MSEERRGVAARCRTWHVTRCEVVSGGGGGAVTRLTTVEEVTVVSTVEEVTVVSTVEEAALCLCVFVCVCVCLRVPVLFVYDCVSCV